MMSRLFFFALRFIAFFFMLWIWLPVILVTVAKHIASARTIPRNVVVDLRAVYVALFSVIILGLWLE